MLCIPKVQLDFDLFEQSLHITIAAMALLGKRITPFLLVLALTALNGAEFFHHHDGCESKQQESKCHACILSNSAHQTIIDSSCSYSPYFVHEFSLENYVTPINDTLKKDNLKNKAPPAA